MMSNHIRMMKKSFHSSDRDSHRLSNQSFFNRLDKDTQRQVSNSTKRLERKMSNNSWTKHMLNQYFKLIKSIELNQNQRYGVPKQALNMEYIVKTHDQIKGYINKYPDTRLGKEAGDIYTKLSRATLNLQTKAERYNLRVDLPKTLSNDKPMHNGERIHIKLEEVL